MSGNFSLSNLKIFKHPEKMADAIDELMEKDDSSFYVGNMGELIENFKLWKKHLPNVTPFYAVKANDELNVVKVLSALGCNFDCASQDEIAKVLSLGISPDRIVFANPTKSKGHLIYAAEQNVKLMTFDTEQELVKIREYHPSAKLLIRIRSDAKEASIQMGHKFGCAPDNAMNLILKAIEMDLNIVGIAFHVGTGCREPEAFPRAIRICAGLLKEAKSRGINLKIVDVGGGFPENEPDTFAEMATLLKGAVNKEPEIFKDVKLMAEPGRYFAASSFVLYASVVGIRHLPDITWYYINHGIVGAFNCVFSENLVRYPYAWKPRAQEGKPSLIWGPADIQKDLLVEKMLLPPLENGDWLAFPTMGAYTICLDPVKYSNFPKPEVHYHILQEDWDVLKEASTKSKEHLNLASFV